MLAVLVPADSPDPQATYDLLRRESALYSPELAAKPHVVVVTKEDLVSGTGYRVPGTEDPIPDTRYPMIRTEAGAPVLGISAVSRQGLPELLEVLWRTLKS